MQSLIGGALIGLLAAGVCLAQEPAVGVTVTFKGVNSAKGEVNLSLCGDAKGQFPGGCGTYRGQAKAVAGDTVVTIQGVKPGRYALQAWHDENSDGRTQIPPEGYAYGNDVSFPPRFDAASIEITGETKVSLKMNYTLSATAARPMGSKGAAAPKGIVRTDVREGGLYGALYTPEGGEDMPGVILLGGSEGGIDGISGMAASFAQKGYAALALAYWAEQGLPQTLERIPLEYFDKGVDYLIRRPDVLDHGVGVLGWSRGSEAALLVGTRNRKVKAVIAIAPSGIVWDGLDFAHMETESSAWTAGGKPLPFITPDPTVYRPGAPMTPMFAATLPLADRRPETAIPVEKIRGSVMLISGMDDQLWPSTRLSDRIIGRLQAEKFRYPYEHLAYPGAGHAIFVGAPDSIMSRYMSGPNPMMGGTPQANRKAWEDNWPKAIAFLDKALKGDAQ